MKRKPYADGSFVAFFPSTELSPQNRVMSRTVTLPRTVTPRLLRDSNPGLGEKFSLTQSNLLGLSRSSQVRMDSGTNFKPYSTVTQQTAIQDRKEVSLLQQKHRQPSSFGEN